MRCLQVAVQMGLWDTWAQSALLQKPSYPKHQNSLSHSTSRLALPSWSWVILSLPQTPKVVSLVVILKTIFIFMFICSKEFKKTIFLFCMNKLSFLERAKFIFYCSASWEEHGPQVLSFLYSLVLPVILT